MGACTQEKDDLASSLPPKGITVSDSSNIDLKSQQNKVIYGEDTRQDVYELVDAELEQRARRSIVAMFDSGNLSINNSSGVVTVQGGTLGRRYRLCNGQRYRNQVTAASCSATLIDDDIIVTAGHCVETQAECETKRFVFGYYMQNGTSLAPINSNQVFTCQRLLSNINTSALDYAFIQLDRPVDSSVGEPAQVTQSAEPLSLNDPLVMMGFPSGLPLKVDAGGFVSDPRGATRPLNYFRATVDAFGGNSGSGVFNSNGEQVGILVRGETDYVSSNQRCTVVNELNQDRGPGEDAEEITYLSRALSALCESGYPSERLCGTSQGGLCNECEQSSDCQDDLQCGRFAQYPEASSFCAPACMQDDDCPANHECSQSQCTPLVIRGCAENQVIADDACGRRLGIIETCATDEYCRQGACLPASAGNACETAIPLLAETQSIQGSIGDGFTSTSIGSCGGDGPEVFYQLDLEQANHLVATSTGYDTIMYLRSACESGSELSCVDDSRPPGRYGSRIDERLSAGTYYLALDSYDPNESGRYLLNIELCEQVCNEGEQRCSPLGNVERCGINREGCVVWQSVEDCLNGAVCDEGRCILPELGDGCESAEVIELATPIMSFEFEGQINEQYRLDAGSQCSPFASFDRFYRFELERASVLSAELGGERATALALYADCPTLNTENTELTCSPNLLGTTQLTEALAPGAYTLVVTSEETAEYSLNLSFVPDCMDECDLNLAPFCDEQVQDNGLSIEVVRECQVSFEGCAKLVAIDECNGRVCSNGQCQEECMNSCILGEHACLSDNTVISCVADERACTFWTESSTCDDGEVCVDAGRCISEEQAGEEAGTEIDPMPAGQSAGELARDEWHSYSGPKEVEVPIRSRGGCDQQSRKVPSLLWLFLLGFFSFRKARIKLKFINSLRSL